MAKLLKFTISGSYRNSSKEVVDFENVTGLTPFVDEDISTMHVRGRYAVMWIKAAVGKDGKKIYTSRIEDMRQTFIENIEIVDADQLSYVGKDIKEMSYEELQDLATAKDMRKIPLPKELSGVSLREMRAIAYNSYWSDVLLNPEIKDVVERFGELQPLIVDGSNRRDTTQKFTNEEIIQMEQNATRLDVPVKDQITIEELRDIAAKKGVTFHPNISKDALYAKLFSAEVAAA